ncbi:N-acetylmuramoyl-L-alanine amidase family protein [Clostridium saccharobutylicum]|uniref:Collagenolytic protease n=1 Tax=Clostridium saccharobutylicum DSM 13864 TaxID=1345695 RepID=U5MX80_CLOSA|nr:cadherin-like beta sandwich domain-containing protein [Clostridium saccharobutylicum]AGX45148.1 collagenolytic protease [Clostridium saccharobutylicum DSM 13864]AQR92428.1 autolysin [Clostridium saccharobutylicum]AQS02331.1 autolysin [Clostridium saccharobutylicum]AQS16314.1 autolysin [Clostridium saccharobutylicum]MBA2904991.1 glucan-binding YG repeat protein [Clostridium saccharobutylicum]
MNKRIRRIIAVVLAVSAFSTIEPTKYMNITGITKAYASSTVIDNFQVNKAATDNELNLYEDEDYEDTTNFKASTDTYYVKTSSSSINFTFDTNSNYVTKVFKDDSKTGTPFDSGEEINLDKGTNTLYVRTYKESKFDKNNVKTNVIEEYKIVVERKTNSTNDVQLSKISLDYGDISFSKSQTSYDVDVNSSVDQIEITAKPSKKSYTVKIAGDEVTEDDDYQETVDLRKGANEIEINVTDDDGNENTYTLNIYRGGKSNTTTDNSDIDTTQDKIYLKDLKLNNGDVELDYNKQVTKYNVNVDSSVNKLTIKAEPQDDNDTVKVNGGKVDSDYEKTVNLDDNSTKEIQVKVKNSDGEQRIYTLNVTRGTVSQNSTTNNTSTDAANNTSTNTTSNTTTNDTNTNNNSTNQTTSNNTVVSKWVKDTVSDKWKYYDDKGDQVKGKWFYYINDNHWYYLDDQGNMKTGWLSKDYKWYYLDENGIMQIGWVNLSGTWYYLNADGSMRTGWLQEGTKKYYLNSNGAMQTGTATINGKSYTFDTAGAMSN